MTDAYAGFYAAKDLIDEVISDGEPGDAIDISELAMKYKEHIDPAHFLRVAESYWSTGELEQGDEKREYIIQ